MSTPDAERPDLRVATRNLVATVAIVSLLVGAVVVEVCTGARPERAEARCSALLDRFVELRERQADPKVGDLVVEQRKVEARAHAAETQALELCTQHLTEDNAACADRANTINELEQCFP